MPKNTQTKLFLMVLIVLITTLFLNLDTTPGLLLVMLILLIMDRLVDKRLPPLKQPAVGNLMSILFVIVIVAVSTLLHSIGLPSVISLPLTITLALIVLPYFRPYTFRDK